MGSPSRTPAIVRFGGIVLLLLTGRAVEGNHLPRPPVTPLTAVDTDPGGVTLETVQAMLDSLVERMLDRHHPTRHWEPVRPPSGQSPQPTGRTALVVLALLDAGLPAQTPEVATAIDWLSRIPADGTYAIATRLMVWCRLPEFDRERRRECDRLLERFSVAGGGWDYGPSPRLGFIDQSLTQFGLQAISEAARRGIPIPDRIYDRIRSRLLATQNPDGGWGYRDIGDPSRGSMTAAGVASLALIEDRVPSSRDGRQATLDAMAMAMRWLATRFDVETNPGCTRWHLYWIHALERAARATGLGRLGTHDWFQESAAMIRRRLFLVEPRTPPKIRGDPRIDRLALAMLVLRRGLEPVAFACLDVSRDPPIDDLLGDACRLVSERIERMTGWIRITADDPPDSWSRFPVLVVRSPPDAAWLADSRSALTRRLSAFVARGGLVIALPSATGSGVRTFPQRAVTALVPITEDAEPESIAREDPARRRVGRWRFAARQAASNLRRWCVAARVPLRPGALATRIEQEVAAMLASICLERTGGVLPCRVPASLEASAHHPTRTPAAPDDSIRRIEWPGDGLVEPMLFHAWHELEAGSSPRSSDAGAPDGAFRRLTWLSGVGDADPTDLGEPSEVFDPTREFLVVEASSPGFRKAFMAWIDAAAWRIGLPPAGAPSSCIGIHEGGRCIGVLIDDRPARRLLGVRTPSDFTTQDLEALHRAIETARRIDHAEPIE